jgi:hypothetical protein
LVGFVWSQQFLVKFDGLKNIKCSASLKGEEDWASLTETG